MSAPKLKQKSRRIIFSVSALLTMSIGGTGATYAADTVEFDFGQGIRQGAGISPAGLVSQNDPNTSVLSAEPDHLPAAPQSQGAVISAAPLDLSGIELAPGETLVTPGGTPINPNFAAASQGYMPQQPVGGGYEGVSFPCPVYPDKRYIIAETLYMKRGYDEGFTLSDRFLLDEFDYELGMRLTAGYIMEGSQGIDFSYTGLLKWSNQSSYVAPNLPSPPNPPNTPSPKRLANLTIPLVIPPLDPVAFAAFKDARAQSQRWEADYQSFEMNMRNWAWEVISILHGIRVVKYDEDYGFSSTGGQRDFVAGQPAVPAGPGGVPAAVPAVPAIQARPEFTNSLGISTRNFLIGLQVGADLYYPITCTTDMGIRTRAGAFINRSEMSLAIANNLPEASPYLNGLLVNLNEDDTSLAGMIEIGSFVTQRLTDCLSVRGGYEFWYLANVATVPSNVPGAISPSLRGSVNDDDVMFSGFTLGAELKW